MDIAGGEKFDVIVVGAGNAATCAALSAREAGAEVLMLEIAPEEARGPAAPSASSITVRRTSLA
jgi:succinate dehydrogenase/fumarate reductase flavoprotein subunit